MFILFCINIIGVRVSKMVMIIFGMIISMMLICIKRVVRKIRINNFGNIGVLVLIVCSVLIFWFVDISWIINIMFLVRMVLLINFEKVDVVEVCSKICCCFGDIFWIRLNNLLLLLMGMLLLSCVSCVLLGEKICFNIIVINVYSNDINRMVINWLWKKFLVLWYMDCVVIDMYFFWVLCRC